MPCAQCGLRESSQYHVLPSVVFGARVRSEGGGNVGSSAQDVGKGGRASCADGARRAGDGITPATTSARAAQAGSTEADDVEKPRSIVGTRVAGSHGYRRTGRTKAVTDVPTHTHK